MWGDEVGEVSGVLLHPSGETTVNIYPHSEVGNYEQLKN